MQRRCPIADQIWLLSRRAFKKEMRSRFITLVTKQAMSSDQDSVATRYRSEISKARGSDPGFFGTNVRIVELAARGRKPDKKNCLVESTNSGPRTDHPALKKPELESGPCSVSSPYYT